MKKAVLYAAMSSLLILSLLGPVVSLDSAHLLHAPFYHFFHANLLHAGINLYVLYQIVKILRPSGGRLFMAYVIATFIPPVLLAVPVVGLSGCIYALLGLCTPLVARKRYYVFYIVFFIFLQALLPAIAWHIHLYTFLVALLLVLPDCQ